MVIFFPKDLKKTEAKIRLNFIERGNEYPLTGDILVDHEEQAAYRVLDGAGGISTGNAMKGDPNECELNVEIVDYEEYADDQDPLPIIKPGGQR